MGTLYETDVVAWAYEQAALLRKGNWSALDADKVADEIETVVWSEQRELGARMAKLMAHLLKWQLQPAERTGTWFRTIRDQRKSIVRALAKMPSLRPIVSNDEWLEEAWDDACEMAAEHTGLEDLPETCIWTTEQLLDPNFLPD